MQLWGAEQIRFRTIDVRHGLSNNKIYSLAQDPMGFVWIGTEQGLNRYDGYEFKAIFSSINTDMGLQDNSIHAIEVGDPKGIWIGTNGGLNFYEYNTGNIYKFPKKNYQNTPGNQRIRDLILIGESLWIATDAGGLYHLDVNTRSFQNFAEGSAQTLPILELYVLASDGERLWLGTDEGLWVKEDNGFREIASDLTKSYRVRAMCMGNHSLLWFSIKDKLYCLNRVTEEVQITSFDGYDILSLHEDRQGILWVGTRSHGLIRYEPQTKDWIQLKPYESDPLNSLPDTQVRSMMEDSTGIMWFGTRDGLGLRNPAHDFFKNYNHNPDDPNSLTDNKVKGIHEDHFGNIWVGTWDRGLNRISPDGKTIARYTHDPNNPRSLSHMEISDIAEDANGNLLIGTWGEGLDRYDPETDSFINERAFLGDAAPKGSHVTDLYLSPRGELWVGSGINFKRLDDTALFKYTVFDIDNKWVNALWEDSHEQLWVGTNAGLYLYDVAAREYLLFDAEDRDGALKTNQIIGLYETDQGLWVGTSTGLFLKSTDHSFEPFGNSAELSNSVVRGILEDPLGNLWVSTSNGLFQLDLTLNQVRRWTRDDGLQATEFDEFAFARTRDRRLVFGGSNGISVFNPKALKSDTHAPVLRFTQLKISNVAATELKDNLLAKPIEIADHFTLNHRQNMFAFEFAALHFAQPAKNSYRFKLENFNESWLQTAANHRVATYTNLPAGDYRFVAQAANPDGLWGEPVGINLRIKPAPWRSMPAIFIYVLIIFIVIARYLQAQKATLKRERRIAEQQRRLAKQAQKMADQSRLIADQANAMTEKEREVSARLRRLDKLKDEFMANTSHELRTPLNGIIGLSESLIDGATGPLSQDTRHHLAMIVSSGKRLANLVNDILDFSKLKTSSLQLHPKAVDMKSLTELVINIVQPLLGQKPISIINEFPDGMAPVHGDEDRLQQVLFNLLGNAIKYTNKGSIEVGAYEKDDGLVVYVKDTGIGIPKDQMDLIFSSFEQLDGSMARSQGGTGLGLTVTKQLVELHHGKIWLTSEVDEGSTFYFQLPKSDEALEESGDQLGRMMISAHQDVAEELPRITESLVESRDGKGFRILVVDDEPVNRRVLVNHLTIRSFSVEEAANGRDALALIESQDPYDLILLDVMMPGISGYDVCDEIRKKHSVHDLPVIFLTARNRVNDLVNAFSVGGNDYLTKPISKDELLARVHTHIQLVDVNRNLEQKVKSRTKELREANLELETKNKDIIRTQNQLVFSEKMATLGTLTAGIAHEFNNPNNFIYGSIHTLQVELDKYKQLIHRLMDDDVDAELRDTLMTPFEYMTQQVDIIKNGSSRIRDIVTEMMNFTRVDQAEQKVVELQDGIRAAIRVIRSQFPNIDFQLDLGPGIDMMCRPAELNQVYLNLILNGVKAIEDRLKHEDDHQGVIHIEGKREHQEAILCFRDNGCGIDDEHLPRIFEAFYTTRPPGEGSGLGLYTSYRIITDHGGVIEGISTPGQGSTFTIKLPL